PVLPLKKEKKKIWCRKESVLSALKFRDHLIQATSNPIPGNEDEAREPPLVPPHLHHTSLNYSHSQDDPGSLIAPQNVILNHLYIENQDGPSSVVALGITHRFRSKYVTVVLYKPVQRRVESPVSPCQRNPSIYLGSYTGPYHNHHSQ
ncbi:unnamed protein product, partial [Musa acuminata var. zebrina]